MPAFSWRSARNRILLDIAIFRPGGPEDITMIRKRALLDTGATCSGIGPGPIAELDLKSYGKNRLKSATEEVFVSYYLFRLGIFPDATAETPRMYALPYLFDEIDGFSWSSDRDFDVILGMDVLRQCDFNMTRSGNCSLTFGIS